MGVCWPSDVCDNDVVFVVDYVVLNVVIVVICCCCVHACNGDLLVPRKCMVVCVLMLAELGW